MFLLVNRYTLFCIGVVYILTILRHRVQCQSTVVNLQNNTLLSATIPISYDISSFPSYNATITPAISEKMYINNVTTVSYNVSTNIADIFISATVKSYYGTITPAVNGTMYINPTVMSYNNISTISINNTIKSYNFTSSINATLSRILTVDSSAINGSFNSSPCYEKENWKKSVYEKQITCLTNACAKEAFDLFDLYMTCNDWSVTTELQVIGGYVNKYGIQRAEEMVAPIGDNPIKRACEQETKTHFKIEYGFIRRRFLTRSSPVSFPHDLRVRKVLQIPPTVINSKVVSYVFTDFFFNLYKHNEEVDYMEESTPLTNALFLLDGGSAMSYVANIINSKIISFLASPSLTSFTEYVDIVFDYRDYKGTINHKCVHAPGHLGQVQWTNAGCYAVQVLMRSIHCRCNTPQSNFAVLSELYVEPKAHVPFKQEGLTLALVVISVIGAFVCFLCLILPSCVGCSYIGGMIRIYRYSDLTQAAEFIIFIIGVYSSRHETASSLIAVVLHFLHCCVMFWALIEGIYLYHKIKPQYHRSTGTMFFYSTLVFGVSAALTGAVSGYTFRFGTNIQYVWVKAKGIHVIYFCIPIIVLALITIAIDWLLIMQLKNWIGFHDDYVYTRAPYFIRRQSGFVAVCLVTFIFGNMSMEMDGTGYKSYLFAAFFVIQIICRFYSHFMWNYEVWGWKKFNDAHLLGEEEKGKEGYDDVIQATKKQHTIMMMEASSSEESECEEESIEVERSQQRPASVHTYLSQTSMREVEERPVTPRTEVPQVKIDRVNTLNSKVETMNPEEEETDDFGEEIQITKESKKDARLLPRMTKSQLIRLKKLEEDKQKLEEEKKEEEESEREKEQRQLTRKMSRKQSRAGMTQNLLE